MDRVPGPEGPGCVCSRRGTLGVPHGCEVTSGQGCCPWVARGLNTAAHKAGDLSSLPPSSMADSRPKPAKSANKTPPKSPGDPTKDKAAKRLSLESEGSGEGAAATGAELSALEEAFRRFAVHGDTRASGREMHGKNWSKLCRDCQVIDGRSVTVTDVDIVFSKIKCVLAPPGAIGGGSGSWRAGQTRGAAGWGQGLGSGAVTAGRGGPSVLRGGVLPAGGGGGVVGAGGPWCSSSALGGVHV